MPERDEANRIDVSGMQSVARPIAHEVVGIMRRYLADGLLGVVVHGSAVKGGFISGGSDVDFGHFVDGRALDPRTRQLPLNTALAIHADLAALRLAPFRYVQTFVQGPEPSRMSRFAPGTFHVVFVDPPVVVVTERELQVEAFKALRGLDPVERSGYYSRRLLHHVEWNLDRHVRFLCTEVWPLLYHIAALTSGDGVGSWRLTKLEAIDRLPGETPVAETIGRFHTLVVDHYASGERTETALEVLRQGYDFFEATAAWYTAHGSCFAHEDRS